MPATLTLKNIPDEIYERLKAAAQAHRRSLNNEAVVCLQTVLMPASASAEERLQRARALRQRLAGQDFAAADIAALRQEACANASSRPGRFHFQYAPERVLPSTSAIAAACVVHAPPRER